jgi:hypothetical protein
MAARQLTKKSVAASLPDPTRCREKDPVRALEALLKRYLDFGFGYRDRDRFLKYQHSPDGTGYHHDYDLVVSTAVEESGHAKPGPYAPTLSKVFRDLGRQSPDLATLWVLWAKGPCPPKAFAELVGAAVAKLTKVELVPVETETWVRLAQRAANRGSFQAYFDLPRGRVLLEGNGDGAFFVGNLGPYKRWLDLQQALADVARRCGREFDPARVGLHRLRHTWVRQATMVELLARAVGEVRERPRPAAGAARARRAPVTSGS